MQCMHRAILSNYHEAVIYQHLRIQEHSCYKYMVYSVVYCFYKGLVVSVQ